MRRYLEPSIAVFAVALIASVLVHLPVWGALGVLAHLMDGHHAAPRRPPVEVDFEVAAPKHPPPHPSAAPTDPAKDHAPTDIHEGHPLHRPERAQHRSKPPPPVHHERPPPRPTPQSKPRPQPEPLAPQAIMQRSRDPTVPPPPNPHYIARENQRVDRETQARLRNYDRNDAHPTPSRPHQAATPNEGNADQEHVADLNDRRGIASRAPTPEEARRPRPRNAPEHAPSPVHGPDVAEGPQGHHGDGRPEGARVEQRVDQQQGGGQEQVTVFDGVGTFVITRPRRPRGSGEGNQGGASRAGAEVARAGGDQARRGGRAGSGIGSGARGPSLRLSWNQFERVMSPEELRRERETYLRQRRSRRRGSNRARDWRQFRAAIENYLPKVQPGDQTALNAAASPFAEYIAAVHRRIHREFADKFLTGLPSWGMSPFADHSLHTKLEIVLNRDGTVHRIGVVETSGFLPFDYGAYAAVMHGQPYPAAPPEILSGDGRVYVHWGFYRNSRQCGTFNAEPYILPHPPGTPSPGRSPYDDQLQWGGVVPQDAQPTWGTARRGARRAPRPKVRAPMVRAAPGRTAELARTRAATRAATRTATRTARGAPPTERTTVPDVARAATVRAAARMTVRARDARRAAYPAVDPRTGAPPGVRCRWDGRLCGLGSEGLNGVTLCPPPARACRDAAPVAVCRARFPCRSASDTIGLSVGRVGGALEQTLLGRVGRRVCVARRVARERPEVARLRHGDDEHPRGGHLWFLRW